MKFLYVFFVSLFLSVNAAAATKTVETSGSARTLDSAINIAIRRAVEQVSGVSIDSQRVTEEKYLSNGSDESEYSNNLNDKTSLESSGNATYSVLSEHCDNDQCNVTLSVKVKVSDKSIRNEKRPINNNRRTIAVKIFNGSKGSVIANKVEALLSQDRKFKVLLDPNDPNVDYVIEANVVKANTNVNVIDNSRTVALTGEYIHDVKTRYTSNVVVNFKIIDIEQRQVKWATSIHTNSSRNNLNLLLDLSSKKIFHNIKDNIYPLVVIVTDDGSLVFNSGGDTVREGEYYDVFSLGQKIIDPVTKESLGYMENKVALVKVAKVLPKLAYITLVSGEVFDGKKYIARKSTKSIPKKTHKTTVKPTVKDESESFGGIIL
ncbi:MAG: hypothetical protein ACJAZP_002739 [Psychromonas sp.]|jgi:hypothetical protein|uniref:hypothetical protein n=1 Tax=Psychromonas sp. TaxID=1884585 RepID=UPI0039E39A7E